MRGRRFSSQTAMLLMVIAFALVTSGAKAWAEGSSCSYVIQDGDWLSRIAPAHDTTVEALVALNGIADPDRIMAGDTLNVCSPSVSLGRPMLVPGEAQQWADALTRAMPAKSNLRTGDLRLLVALAGPESDWCRATVNPGDADPPVWGPSIGCLQTRTVLQPRHIAAEPWRDRQWLEQSIDHQAESAWIIYEQQGHMAWGPRHWTRDANGDKTVPPKLTDDCASAARPDSCREWWAVADMVLGL